MNSPNEQLVQILLNDQHSDSVNLGELNLMTGKVFVCDPFQFPNCEPEKICITPGKYPVRLAYVLTKNWGMRVAGAGLILSNNQIKNWREATTNPLLIECGLCCFMDIETAKIFALCLHQFFSENPEASYYTKVLKAEFKLYANTNNLYDNDDYDMHFPIKNGLHNIAMFASGLGDGFYSTYWGLDGNVQPVILVVDFGLF